MEYLNIKRGTNKTIDVAVLDEDGAPFDISSSYLYFTVKEYRSDGDEEALMNKSVGDGIVVTSSAYGQATVVITPEDTSSSYIALGPRHKYYWDIQVETGGDVEVVSEGYLTIEETVRRG